MNDNSSDFWIAILCVAIYVIFRLTINSIIL